jgi:hypothetical protein
MSAISAIFFASFAHYAFERAPPQQREGGRGTPAPRPPEGEGGGPPGALSNNY